MSEVPSLSPQIHPEVIELSDSDDSIPTRTVVEGRDRLLKLYSSESTTPEAQFSSDEIELTEVDTLKLELTELQSLVGNLRKQNKILTQKLEIQKNKTFSYESAYKYLKFNMNASLVKIEKNLKEFNKKDE